MPFKLDPLRPIRAEVCRVLDERLRKDMAAAASTKATVAARVHTARTGTKKLRALLALACRFDRKRYRRERRHLAQAARRLSRLRDSDAMFATLAELERHQAATDRVTAIRAVRLALGAVERQGRPSRREAEANLQAFVRDARRAARVLGARPASGTFAELAGAFGQSYRCARRAFAAVKCEPSARAFHAWRKSTKTHAYQCRLLRAAWPSAMKALHGELQQLADGLGAEHDLTVLRQQLRRLWREQRLAVELRLFTEVTGVITARRSELRAELLPLGERLFVDPPALVRRRLRCWWRIAQRAPLVPAVP